MSPKKVRLFKTRPEALRFTLTPSFAAMKKSVWDTSLPDIPWFKLPTVHDYNHHSGVSYRRCRIEAFDYDKNSLGFIPLPLRYRGHWIQLCYSIVHTLCEWEAWLVADPSSPKIPGYDRNFIRKATKQNAARLLHYLTIRRKIVEELLSHKMDAKGGDHLDVFDEYLIRESRGWLWKTSAEIPSKEEVWMKADPADPKNAKFFDWSKQSHLSPQLLPPSGDDSWVFGTISHYDFQKSWNERLKLVVGFCNVPELLQEHGEETFQSRARIPDVWHERDNPPVRFLTEQEDRYFNHNLQSNPPAAPGAGPALQRPNPGLPAPIPPAAAGPANAYLGANPVPPPPLNNAALVAGAIPGPANGPLAGAPSRTPTFATPVASGSHLPLDCPEAKAIIEAFADRSGFVEIPPTISALERLFGPRFDGSLWSKVLDSLTFTPDEGPHATVDQAWGLVMAAQRAADAASQSGLGPWVGGQGLQPRGSDEGTDYGARMDAFLALDQSML